MSGLHQAVARAIRNALHDRTRITSRAALAREDQAAAAAIGVVLAETTRSIEHGRRYGMNIESDATEWLSPDPEGDWMRVDDALAVLAALGEQA